MKQKLTSSLIALLTLLGFSLGMVGCETISTFRDVIDNLGPRSITIEADPNFYEPSATSPTK